MNRLLRTCIGTGFLMMVSCASYKNQYSKKDADWEQHQPASSLKLSHTMYLVGDAGKVTDHHIRPVLTYLKGKLSEESTNSSVLFLGDNIYESGMAPKEEADARRAGEESINAQLDALNDFKGYPIFIPGNHDWRGWGLKGIKEQEKYIEAQLNERRGKADKDDWENYFFPDDGCSGPQAIELNDNVVVIAIDSQWWLQDWDDEKKLNVGCPARNRATFTFMFENMVRKYKNKNLVIAMHHPLYTYGPHGGASTLKSHLFPITQLVPNAYVPLPVLGSVIVGLRNSIGSRQDLAHGGYRDLRSSLLAGARKNGSFIFASGHEHALEYIEGAGQKFIVSGSGSKNSPVKIGKGAAFVSGASGYSALRFYEGGEVWTQFYSVSKDGSEATLIFQKKIKSAAPVLEEKQHDFSEYEKHMDSIEQRVVRTEVKPVRKAHTFLLGQHHRDLYMEKYPFPILDLSTFKGGITPTKLGGGNQTNSLRLEDSEGHEYVFRDMTKDASRFLPFPFNKMIATQYLVEDNFLSTHPFAPLAAPRLAEAMNVYHSNPRIYYVPAQPGLGIYNAQFGGSICLVEERPAGKHWKKASFYGNPEDIISTPELLENITKSNKHKVDYAWTLRTRMLDLLIGDWDRHDDQWTWARINQPDGMRIYRPIPRDRDQAFSKYDGLLIDIANYTLPFLRQLQTYGPEINNYKWNTWSARLFDRTFLNELDWQQWKQEVEYVQQHLTDEAIENAFIDWPEKARKSSAPDMIKAIKKRRDDLMKIARIHFEFVSESVNVLGTDERERVVVERLDDNHTRVTVYEISKKGEIKQKNYERLFENDITNSINIYGSGDDDEFEVIGNVKKGIRVRLIGGSGKDVFSDQSHVGGGKHTLVYDDLGKNEITPSSEIKDKRTSRYSYNLYDRRGYDSEYDILLPLPIIGFNPDDGLLLGANFNFINYGFKKEPYASSHQFGGSYAFATKAFKLNYQGDYINALGKNTDFFLDAAYHGPTYAFNFAGIGNDTERIPNSANFYRVRQSSLRIYPALKKRFAGNSGYITIGPSFQATELENTPGRFINQINNEKGDLFDHKFYAGAELGIHYNNVDNFFSPHHGIRFHAGANWTANLKDSDKKFTALNARLAFYQNLDRKENLILASQIGGAQNLGDGFEFFQLPTIGSQQGLRGYRTQRFYGKSVFYHTTDLRWRLLSTYNRVLPLTTGIFGSFDYGRVWYPEIHSDTWHYSYGGGIWVAPIDILTLSVGAFIPKEDAEQQPWIIFRLGFSF